MSQDLTISLPEKLRQQAIDFAATRGETVDTVVREAVAQYVSVLAPEAPPAPPPGQPRTELGARLKKLRDQVLATEGSALRWDDLQRELAERRGERDHAAFDLR
jgi:hypothetical protein